MIHYLVEINYEGRINYQEKDGLNWTDNPRRALAYTDRAEVARIARRINKRWQKLGWRWSTVGVRSFPSSRASGRARRPARQVT